MEERTRYSCLGNVCDGCLRDCEETESRKEEEVSVFPPLSPSLCLCLSVCLPPSLSHSLSLFSLSLSPPLSLTLSLFLSLSLSPSLSVPSQSLKYSSYMFPRQELTGDYSQEDCLYCHSTLGALGRPGDNIRLCHGTIGSHVQIICVCFSIVPSDHSFFAIKKVTGEAKFLLKITFCVSTFVQNLNNKSGAPAV